MSPYFNAMSKGELRADVASDSECAGFGVEWR
jgi:hypothetical protein